MSAIEYIGENFIVDTQMLEKNIAGRPNVYIFYQSNITNNASYPVVTSLFLLNTVKQILEKTKGVAYLLYHEPEIISEVYNDQTYNTGAGKTAYYNQINYLKNIARDKFKMQLNVRSIQNYVENEPQIQNLYSKLKTNKPFEKEINYWLSWFSKPARLSILNKVLVSKRQANIAENAVFLKNTTEAQREKYTDLLQNKFEEIVNTPQFEKYSIYELLATVGMQYTNNAFFRPNQGNNESMQLAAKQISEEYAEKIFNQNAIYAPVYSLKNLDALFSFVHPYKKEAGVEVKFARTNELLDLEQIIQVQGQYKKKYLQKLSKQFPNWQKIINQAKDYNNQIGIANTLPNFGIVRKIPDETIKNQNQPKLTLLSPTSQDIPATVQDLIEKRARLREKRSFKSADEIRDLLIKQGYYPEDTPINKLNV